MGHLPNDILYLLTFIGLLTEAVIDILQKKIWLPVIIIELPVLIGIHYMFGQGSISLWVASVGAAFFYVVSIVSREQLGKGDALLFGLSGAGVGLWNNLILIYLTFLLAFFGAVFLLVVKKAGRSQTMPLAPFLLAAYLILLCSGLQPVFAG